MLGGGWRRLLGPWLWVEVSECFAGSWAWELLSELCGPSGPSRSFEVSGGGAGLGY